MLSLVRDLFRRLGPEDDTSGPGDHVRTPASVSPWEDGWYARAARRDAHPGRVGQAIAPWAVVVHETQMHPDSFGALIRRTQRVAGKGNCYHFLIGRSPDEGVVQVAPIGRNANHAGGQPHGWLVSDGRGAVCKHHPNLASVGIELHCAGTVSLVQRQWRTMDAGRPFGRPIPDSEVDVRGSSAGIRAEHRPTIWQLEQLDQLLRDLCPVLAERPVGLLSAVPSGEARTRLPQLARTRLPIWGHRELSPDRKSDPSLATLEYLVGRGW
jgi:hypothetical protein